MAKKKVISKKKATISKVKTKGRKTKGSKMKDLRTLFETLKNIVLAALLLLFLLLGLLYLREKHNPTTAKTPAKQEKTEQQRVKPTAKPVKSTKKRPVDSTTDKQSFKILADAALPRLLSNEKEQIVAHEGYTVSFNPTYKQANWVAYELTGRESVSKKYKRKDKFLIDKKIKGGTADNGDYTRTGFDRGHLAPAADMSWSRRAMDESFFMSNISPQSPQLNRGIWKELEELVRDWAVTDSAILIATGPLLSPKLKRLGKNRVAIPNAFYKVIVSPHGKNPKGIGFIFENKGYKGVELSKLVMSIDAVEERAQIDFFVSLPDDLEERIESKSNSDHWKFN